MPHDLSPVDSMFKSLCHDATLLSYNGDEGTSHYVCSVCQNACDSKLVIGTTYMSFVGLQPTKPRTIFWRAFVLGQIVQIILVGLAVIVYFLVK